MRGFASLLSTTFASRFAVKTEIVRLISLTVVGAAPLLVVAAQTGCSDDGESPNPPETASTAVMLNAFCSELAEADCAVSPAARRVYTRRSTRIPANGGSVRHARRCS